jgi:phytoene desaturase
MEKHQHKAVVIGAGVGGLSVAIRLALKGYEVDVFEKNSYPGGKLSFFEQDGYKFDAGPSLFTQPQHLYELFELAGEDINQYIKIDKVDIACRYFFEDGKIINAYADTKAFAAELKEKVNEDEQAVIKYLQGSAKLYNNVGRIFLQHSLHKRKTWLHRRIFPALATVRGPHLFGTLNGYNRSQFRSAEAVQIFNRFATYNGSNAYKAPGMLSLIPHLEMNEGTFYPKGGMISITNALFELAKKKGVRFHFNQPVDRIIHHEGKIRGVVVDHQNIHAHLVVSNMDVYFTYKSLLNDPDHSKKILRQERSSSALIFYWGIGKRFPQLHLHNIFFSKDYSTEFYHIFNRGKLFADPTVYINNTAFMEEGMAPAGKENWFVMLNAPANKGQNWDDLKQQGKTNILSKLSRLLGENIEKLIETEAILDPVNIETNTSSYMGSLYGTSSNSRMAAFLRHPNFSSSIKGLFFVGGSVHPGGGIPLCFCSAAIVDSFIKPL